MDARSKFSDAGTDHTPSIPTISHSYDRYISSGLYDRKYPGPNRRTLRTLLRHLPEDGHFLDFGAGTGRYCLPMMAVKEVTGVAYDTCSTACATLADRLAVYVESERLTVRCGSVHELANEYKSAFSLVILAFGVLGHVSGRGQRLDLLRTLCGLMAPGGNILLGVPNARRRFHAEQRLCSGLVRQGKLECGDILYSRGSGKDQIPMFYHLFTGDEIVRDLEVAGFSVTGVSAESLLPEEVVVSNPLLGWLDDIGCSLVPASLGYDLLVTAERGTV